MKKYNVAVLSATGAVGQELLSLLQERNFPAAEIKTLASARSAGKEIEVAGISYTIEAATPESFADVDIAFFCAGGSVSQRACTCGCCRWCCGNRQHKRLSHAP